MTTNCCSWVVAPAARFALIAANLLPTGQRAAYLDTGTWASGALREGAKFGQTELLWSGQDGGYKRVPGSQDWQLQGDEAYLHYCSDDTIYGTQYEVPQRQRRPVCDMSSDILSRPVDVSRYAHITRGLRRIWALRASLS